MDNVEKQPDDERGQQEDDYEKLLSINEDRIKALKKLLKGLDEEENKPKSQNK